MTPEPVGPQDPRLSALHAQAREIFTQALRAASIPAEFERRFLFENGVFMRRRAGKNEHISLPLSAYKKIYTIAVGKAALSMLDTVLERLPRGLPVRGICCAPALPERLRSNIRYYAGGHPSPNLDSFRAARACLRLLHQAQQDSFVLFLISGGGSSLFEAPLDEQITFEDTIAFHRALVGSGATIAEINTVRKHFSAVKGGRLAAAAGAATKFSLLVSDVPSGHLDALASGPTLPDRSTIAECRDTIDRYRLLDLFPSRVRNFFTDPDLPETPGEKSPRLPAANQNEQSGMPTLPHSSFDVLLSNDDLVQAARAHAESLGWKVFVDNACDDWDSREAARYLLHRLHQLRKNHGRVCLLSGGEVTVRLEGNPGMGGRNQQFALACALRLARCSPDLSSRYAQPFADLLEPDIDVPVAILSAGSDGVDGSSPAAGAIADATTVVRAQAQGLDAAEALRSFNAYPLFATLGDAVDTGLTNNNLRDLRILLSC